jgi:hypothetical protein
MLQSLINAFFGCSHRKLTFPQSPTRKSSGYSAPGSRRHDAYVTCLDCGKELAYDWEGMRVGKPVSERRPAAEAQPSFLR